jgi:transposase-like protein
MPSSAPRPGRRPDPSTRQRWQQRLERFRHSGLTVPAFCDREGISAASFYAWRRRLQHDTAAPADDMPRLVPVHLVTPPASAPVELLLPSGCVLRLSPDCDVAWLRQLLPVLGVEPC